MSVKVPIEKWTKEDSDKRLRGMAQSLIKGNYQRVISKTGLAFVTLSDKSIKRAVLKADTYLDRVQVIGQHFPLAKFQELIDSVDKALGKNEMLASIMKANGDNQLTLFELKSAMKCYNLAILFAPKESKIIGKTYWRRATMMYEWRKFQVSLLDTQQALMYRCSKNLEVSLMKRQSKCEQRNKGDQKIATNSAERNYVDNVLFKVRGEPKPKTPEIGSLIRLERSPQKGRHIVADSVILPGTTVIVEDPYVKILFHQLKWDIKFCAKCFEKMETIVPCPGCVFATYCSRECLEQDFKDGHEYECPCLPYLHAVRIKTNLQMALKIVCKTGPEILTKLFEISKTRPNPKEFLERRVKTYKFGDDAEKIHPYTHVLNMVSHLPTNQMPTLTWMSMSIAYLLSIKTSFCDKFKEPRRTEFIYFLASVLLKHSVAVPVNTTAIYRDKKDKRSASANSTWSSKFKTTKCTQIGCGIYPVSDMLNHSCDPTVYRQQLSNGRICIVTNRNCRPEEELLLSYGPEFSSLAKSVRQIYLHKTFNFQCRCIACAKKWPLMWKVLEHEPRLICPSCSPRCPSDLKGTKCRLSSHADYLRCKNCRETHDLDYFGRNLLRYTNETEKAKKFLSKKNPLEAIPILINCIFYFQSVLGPPSSLLIIAQQLLDKAYGKVIHSN